MYSMSTTGTGDSYPHRPTALSCLGGPLPNASGGSGRRERGVAERAAHVRKPAAATAARADHLRTDVRGVVRISGSADPLMR